MEQAPSFDLSYLNSDETFHLNDHIGHVIMLTFWTSWCPDSARDLPKKEQLYNTINHDNVHMVTINVPGRERDPEAGIQFAHKYLNQPTLQDDGRRVYDRYKCDGVPSTVIINQAGLIYAQFGDQTDFLTIVETLGEVVD
ncbi:TlpA disulfide reductase family protein [Thalassobacillus sp. CUG 92003]|uniref:TlpA family protein disulfide reductase n=1 Tax=Thalassobacillus sp. CUG 92003 TaxID=2736641 RepID=UPI0015E66D36|nr:TlpA disulfide reductase family protein [Thalassobacillus sp. CUG 92003]